MADGWELCAPGSTRGGCSGLLCNRAFCQGWLNGPCSEAPASAKPISAFHMRCLDHCDKIICSVTPHNGIIRLSYSSSRNGGFAAMCRQQQCHRLDVTHAPERSSSSSHTARQPLHHETWHADPPNHASSADKSACAAAAQSDLVHKAIVTSQASTTYDLNIPPLCCVRACCTSNQTSKQASKHHRPTKTKLHHSRLHSIRINSDLELTTSKLSRPTATFSAFLSSSPPTIEYTPRPPSSKTNTISCHR